MENSTPRQLPIVEYESKRWYFDARLREIRNVENPHDAQHLDELEMDYFAKLAVGEPIVSPVRIVWKDEGRDGEGRSFGPAYTEDETGKAIHNYGWITWKRANEIAEELGIDLQEV